MCWFYYQLQTWFLSRDWWHLWRNLWFMRWRLANFWYRMPTMRFSHRLMFGMRLQWGGWTYLHKMRPHACPPRWRQKMRPLWDWSSSLCWMLSFKQWRRMYRVPWWVLPSCGRMQSLWKCDWRARVHQMLFQRYRYKLLCRILRSKM